MLRNYFASYETVAEIIEVDLLPHLHYRLFSYYALMKLNEKTLERVLSPDILKHYTALMLDSGAFSARNDEVQISLPHYLEFCFEHYDKFRYFVNLDTIPDDFRNPTMVEKAAKESQNNYLDMRDFFDLNEMDVDRIIPVYHQGEDPKSLDWMLEHRIPYIGLSPSNESVGNHSKRIFLNECFWKIQSSPYAVKTHAFGLSSYDLLGLKPNGKREFPFYSADSTTWADNARNGRIIVPKRKLKFEGRRPFQAKWDFSAIEPVLIGSVAKKLGDPNHYLKSKPPERIEEINEYVRDFRMHVGNSEFHERDKGESDDEWADLEAPLSPRRQKSYLKKKYGDNPPDGIIVTEELKLMDDGEPRIGLTHYTPWMFLINVITVNNWLETINKLDPIVEPDPTEEEIKARKELDQKIHSRLNMKKLPKFRRTT